MGELQPDASPQARSIGRNPLWGVEILDSESADIKAQAELASVEAEKLKTAAAARARDERGSVALSAAIFALGTFLSRILGLVRDMMTARYFPNDVRDAFINAFRLPNLFRRLLGEGSLSISFIPIFVEILSGKGSKNAEEVDLRAKRLVAGVFSILMSVSITLSLLATIFMDDILRFLLSGEAYLSIPGKFELTVRLGRIMFGFLILVSLYAFFMAILNSVKKFAMTALAPCFFNDDHGSARFSRGGSS
jgi:putative peptidoglycan lipid II flippase